MEKLEEKSLEGEPLTTLDFIEDVTYISGAIILTIIACEEHFQVYEPIKEYISGLF